jgi:hypothetical protein
MKENESFRQGFRGFFISLVFLLLALLAVSISAKFLYPENAYCGDMVGAGFPAMFICDDWGGGSPTSSWGKIDFVDVLNGGLIPSGFLIDLVFYFLLSGFFWVIASSILRKGLNRGDLWWTIFIGLGFITGLLCAFLAFLPSYLNYVRRPVFNRTATPIFVPSPTGTLSTAPPTLAPTTTSSP